PINFSDELMAQSENSMARMHNAVSSLRHLEKKGADGPLTEEEAAALKSFQKHRTSFEAAMDDDLNTADAITAVFELIRDINVRTAGGATKEFASLCRKMLQELAGVLGLLIEEEGGDEIPEEIRQLAEERQEARAAKNYTRADEIRDILKEKGYAVKDTPQGMDIVRI
ncbi:MAG: cysteine--tRNA ligase, partial [Firmicutes bacterium]|nr:cysteine--tRNA ligase [Bacillota bacterium]